MSTKEYNYLYKITYNDKGFSIEKQDEKYQLDFLEVFYLDKYDEKIIEKSRSEVFNRYKNNVQLQTIFSNFKQHQKRFPFELSNETIFCFLFSFDYFYYFHNCLSELYVYEKISDNTFENLINIIKN